MTKKIAVSGCGWLGLPLAELLIEKGYSVNGSTTSTEKKEILSKAGIRPFLLSYSENGINGDISAFLDTIDILVINIPPKLRKNTSGNYVGKMKYLIKEIEVQNIKKVVFASSTSVYANDNTVITEETKAIPETESGKQILEVEQLLLNNPNFKTTIIRFGGLIGKERHPVHFLSGRKNVKNPDAPLNLIHLNDCIGIISKIIEKDAWGHIFNAVHPDHPIRKVYYTEKAIEKGLTPPLFEDSGFSTGKTISSEKLNSVLGYLFTTKI
ncbi:SDR family NAD(P)-dependent oxidoreductase [Flavobacteriaceae bacterium R38]|nr:SDR family NAD(P)-dependent oxidoreductase [Flavobacteriaceae bacterium R38]